MRISLLFYCFVFLGTCTSIDLVPDLDLLPNGQTGEVSELYSKAYFEWKIEDIFYLTMEGYYLSPTFLFCGESWYLKIHRNDESDNEASGFIGLYIVRGNPNLNVPMHVDYTLGIKRADNTKENMFESSTTDFELYFWSGTKKFLDRAELMRRRSELAPSKILTITCTMEVGEVFSLKSVHKLSADMKNLLLVGQDHDVILRVKDKDFRAHKAILAARSTVFSSILKQKCAENDDASIYTLDDCEPNAFSEFLSYVYTGKADNISIINVRDLYHIANKFLFPELKQQCVQMMMSSLSSSSVTDVLLLAAKNNETDLLRSATDFLHINIEAILLTPELQSFVKENPIAATELYIKALKTCYAKN